MQLKPAKPGSIVRDPITHVPLPEEGRRVPNNSFWRRRVKAGDAVEVLAAAPPPAVRESAAKEPPKPKKSKHDK